MPDEDALAKLRIINPAIADVLESIRPHVKTDEQLERIRKGREIASRTARAEVAREAYLRHLPERLRKMATTPLTETPQNKKALAAAQALDIGQNLYLYGPRGTGKTHLALRIALRLIAERGVTAKFYAWDDYINAVLATFQQDKQPEGLTHHEVLVLDDVDKRTGRTDFISEQLWNVLQRLNHTDTKTTIITANHPAPKVARLFFVGDEQNQAALASRLAYYMENVHMSGRDGRAEHGQ